MKKTLKYVGIVVIILIVGLAAWIISSENRQITAIQVFDRIVTSKDNSTFVFKSNGDIEIFTIDCEDTGIIGWEGTPNTRNTKIEGVNHKEDEVERVSSQFLRINGRLYDAFVAEFQRIDIDRTNNISNDINEKTFSVTDEEEQYFTDDTNYYFYENYPTFRACLRMGSPLPPGPNDQPLELEPIQLSEFQLESPVEERFYIGQDNNIFIDDPYREDEKMYTPFAELNNMLYFKSESGKYVEVPDVNPNQFSSLEKNYQARFLTDGQHILFKDQVLNLSVDTFKPINSHFFEIDEVIYYVPDVPYYKMTLTKTEIDPETFEIHNKTGSFSGNVYQDKDYIYDLKYRNTEWSDVVKIPR